MDRIEEYVDRVCRRIGGQREMRAHVRQELREHLADAVAELRAAGLGEEEAIGKALEDFGAPEAVRGELEETHGHRLTAVVIEKAMEWKETTMKTKWVWMTLAHVALGLTIFLELAFVWAAMVFVVPKCEEIVSMAGGGHLGEYIPMTDGLLGLLHFVGEYVLLAFIVVGAAWGFFEWRVQGENKGWVRLSVMGLAAVALMWVVGMTAAVMTIPVLSVVPRLNARPAEEMVRERMEKLERLSAAMDAGVAKKEWGAVDDAAHEGSGAAGEMEGNGASAAALLTLNERAKVEEVRGQMRAMHGALLEARDAAVKKDEKRAVVAVQAFHEAFDAVKGVGGK